MADATISSDGNEDKTAPGIRWWPAAVIVAVAAIVIAPTWVLWPGDVEQGHAAIIVAVTMFLSVISLGSWMAFFSRMSKPVRKRSLIVLVIASVVFAASFRIRGYDGGLAVLLEFRWRRQRPVVVEVDKAADVKENRYRDFPQFLGPNRNGVLSDPGISFDWDASPPKLLWRRDIGPGWSSFAVVGDFAFTQQQDGEDETVVCLELLTGKARWIRRDKTRYGEKWEFGGVGPRSTPTVHEGRVYTVGATGLLNCLRASDGELLWSKDLLADNDTDNIQWGFCCSPLIVNEKVIVSAGGAGGKSLVAYHKDDGRRLWSGGDDPASYSSPILATIAGAKQVLIVNAQSIVGHDLASGAVLWRYKRPGNMPSVSQPVPLSGDRVFIAKGYGEGCAMLQISRDGDEWSVKKLWSSIRMKPKFSNVVVRDGYVYGLDNVLLSCLDIRDGKAGKRQWAEREFDYGQVLLVGDVLLIQKESGELVAARASPDGYKELARYQVLGGHTWNSPVLAGRYYLVRNDREAACYEMPLR
ncbi:MAG: PQQ-like beta-propeller repeat protein [Planctomycetes bacterium]|nr:PQQ-like beta-propeller repeat protein [Planctomycetota bacterium]